MPKKILITGGAGFIGSHLADELLAAGHHVRALDNLEPQVHPQRDRAPAYLDPCVELIIGDVRDRSTVTRALKGIDVVYHLAAAVGVGQSMHEITKYNSINAMGTAVLLEAIAKVGIERLIVASSMSVYGEGLYESIDGEIVTDVQRAIAPVNGHGWDPCDRHGRPLMPIPTPETKPVAPRSIYALLKYGQECMSLCAGEAHHFPVVALRFFNAYGPRQALTNPYTGVLAIFSSHLLNDRRPLVFEDGLQRRDFVNVADIARACHLAMTAPRAPGEVFNIGSGQAVTILEVAESIAAALGRRDMKPEITGKLRVGDIRHCFANVAKAQLLLGYEARVSLNEGLRELVEWLKHQDLPSQSAPASYRLAPQKAAV